MLNACGRTIACGNIGKPLSEVALEDRDLDVMTVEVSSFQLETISTFRPSISVWLDFAPDHLDRYRSVDEYCAAKICGSSKTRRRTMSPWSMPLETLPETCGAHHYLQRVREPGGFPVGRRIDRLQGEPVLRMADTKLRGSHNIENLMATLAVGLARGLTFAKCSRRSRLRAAAAPVRVRARGRRCGLDQRFQGDQPRCGREGAARADARGADRRRQGQGIYLETLGPLVSEKVARRGPDRRNGRSHLPGLERRRAVPDRQFARRCGRARACAGASRVKSSFSLPARRRSTCSKATPIAAINFVPSCTPCPNKTMKLPSFSPARNCAPRRCAVLGGRRSEMDYDEMSEPNMKLSRALLIVLVRAHVVAVAGIIAFNTIKSRQGPTPVAFTSNPKGRPPASRWRRKRRPPASAVAEPTIPTAPREAGREGTSGKAMPRSRPGDARSQVRPPRRLMSWRKGRQPVSIAQKFKIPFRRVSSP